MRRRKHFIPYLKAIVIAFFITLLLRLFVVDFFTIPTDSMTPAIEPGDYIMINKLYNGARFYKQLKFESGKTPETFRIPGYSSIRRNDIVVFNLPTPLFSNQMEMDLSHFYVKRCIGLPGDTLSISNGIYTVNGQTGYGNLREQYLLSHFQGEYLPGTYRTFPFDTTHDWTMRHFGPLFIPAAGQTILLDTVNVSLFRRLIYYETHASLRTLQGKIYLKDSVITRYTFRKNWYFMAGDKIFNSRDSRYIGLIPEDFIIGKAVLVLYSKDPETRQISWKRTFNLIR